jgi:hypothetical protein
MKQSFHKMKNLTNLFLVLFLLQFQNSNAQVPNVTLSVDKTIINEGGGKAILTATLSEPASEDIVIDFDLSGTAKYESDFNANFPTRGNKIIVANISIDHNEIKVDSIGNIFLAYFDRVLKLGPYQQEGIVVAGGNGIGSSANQIRPVGIFVDKHENIYVVDAHQHRIQKWLPNATSGITVAGGNGPGRNLNQLNNPSDIFVDKNGVLYIADTDNDRILKWIEGQSAGIVVAGGNGRGSALNQLSWPWSVVVDSQNKIYIADLGNSRLQVWSANNSEGTTFNFLVTYSGRYAKLALDNNDIVYFSIGDNTSIYPNLFLKTIDMNYPSLAVDNSKNIYILENYTNILQKFQYGPLV